MITYKRKAKFSKLVNVTTYASSTFKLDVWTSEYLKTFCTNINNLSNLIKYSLDLWFECPLQNCCWNLLAIIKRHSQYKEMGLSRTDSVWGLCLHVCFNILITREDLLQLGSLSPSPVSSLIHSLCDHTGQMLVPCSWSPQPPKP